MNFFFPISTKKKLDESGPTFLYSKYTIKVHCLILLMCYHCHMWEIEINKKVKKKKKTLNLGFQTFLTAFLGQSLLGILFYFKFRNWINLIIMSYKTVLIIWLNKY